MKQLLKRLKSSRGETLVESLASIVIFTLASILLLTMITSSAKINTTVKEADETRKTDMLALEETSSGTDGFVNISVNGTALEPIPVSTVTAPDSGLTAFYPRHSEPAGG